MTATVISLLASTFVSAGAIDVPTTPGPLPAECALANERAERAAASLIPGRTWTWALDFQRSLTQLDDVRRQIAALGVCERQFEDGLTHDQRSNADATLRTLHERLEHIEADAQSLEVELRREYPTRFHVARDASDMRSEIRRWWKALQQINAGIRTSALQQRSQTRALHRFSDYAAGCRYRDEPCLGG